MAYARHVLNEFGKELNLFRGKEEDFRSKVNPILQCQLHGLSDPYAPPIASQISTSGKEVTIVDATMFYLLSEIRSFLSIFLTSNSFFPRTLILLTHVLTFAMISPHVLFPLFHFAFTIHTESKRLRTTAKLIRGTIEKQELSTREALRQAPSPIRSRIARLRQWSASTPIPLRTRDATLYHEESSPRGLPTSTIPHDRMKRRQVTGSESVPCSPTPGRHLETQTTAPHQGSQ